MTKEHEACPANQAAGNAIIFVTSRKRYYLRHLLRRRSRTASTTARAAASAARMRRCHFIASRSCASQSASAGSISGAMGVTGLRPIGRERGSGVFI